MEISTFEKDSSGTIYLTLKIETTSADNFLKKEEDLANILNEAGRLATIELLKQYDQQAKVIELPSGRHYSKGVQKKSLKVPMAGLK